MGLEFGQVLPCFWDVAPMRAFSEGDVGWFGVRFGHGRSHGKLRGGLEDPFLSGSSYYGGTETWFWDLGRDSPVLGRGSHEGSHIG